MVGRGTTRRQQRVLDFLAAYCADHGVPPTLREINAALGYASTNASLDHLRRLSRKGLVEHVPHASRGWRPAGVVVGLRAITPDHAAAAQALQAAWSSLTAGELAVVTGLARGAHERARKEGSS